MNNFLTSPHNPILKGLYADPHIIYHNGQFYIYPTTDGNAWNSVSFDCFSSSDLIHWKKIPHIFDVSSDDVPWATGLAWAPAVIYRNGLFYFYYCANQKIGVAYSKNPTGPFINASVKTPLLEMSTLPEQITLNQTIDPFAFIDEDDTPYLYFGNGETPAVAKLNEDMTSLKMATMQNIAFTSPADFCEAITVFKKDNLYHFNWSCNDTRSEDYHINYGISTSPMGPIQVIGTVLSKDAANKILATGHHSIVYHPNTDSYYIAYHRFAEPAPKGITRWDRGYNREICIDNVTFNDNGFMNPIQPTF